MTFTLHHGDALDVLRTLSADSIDAMVTDPPAGIAFMGKTWDRDHGGRDGWVRAFAAIFAESLRVLKPGARALVWGIPRTSHWTACALEDAGFIVENRLAHFFGSGFPKGKSQLKPAVEDWWLVRKPGGKVPALNIDECRVAPTGESRERVGEASQETRYTDDGGTNLAALPGIRGGSPAGRWPPNLLLSHHPECVEVGTRQIEGHKGYPNGPGGKSHHYGSDKRSDEVRPNAWSAPATDADGLETVRAFRCVDGCPVKMLDEQSGEVRGAVSNGRKATSGNGPAGIYAGASDQAPSYGDTGTASRFFPQFSPDPFLYAAKASRRERNEGCEGLPLRRAGTGDERESGTFNERLGSNERRNAHPVMARNVHPTVKPQALMRWLCRLITPPGATVLDPFTGSGSTGVAAIAEGMRFVGVEREAEYVEIARARLVAASQPAAQVALAL